MQYFARKFFECNILATLANGIKILQPVGGGGPPSRVENRTGVQLPHELNGPPPLHEALRPFARRHPAPRANAIPHRRRHTRKARRLRPRRPRLHLRHLHESLRPHTECKDYWLSYGPPRRKRPEVR